MWWRILGLIHCARGKRALVLALRGWMEPVSQCQDHSIDTVTWKTLNCAFGIEPTRTMISASIGRWKKKESLKSVGLMKENVIAWLATVLTFGLARFVGAVTTTGINPMALLRMALLRVSLLHVSRLRMARLGRWRAGLTRQQIGGPVLER